jgi:hypothetical protein
LLVVQRDAEAVPDDRRLASGALELVEVVDDVTAGSQIRAYVHVLSGNVNCAIRLVGCTSWIQPPFTPGARRFSSLGGAAKSPQGWCQQKFRVQIQMPRGSTAG